MAMGWQCGISRMERFAENFWRYDEMPMTYMKYIEIFFPLPGIKGSYHAAYAHDSRKNTANYVPW